MIHLPTRALRKAGGRTVLQTAADLGVGLALIFWLIVCTVVLAPRAWPSDWIGMLTTGLTLLFIGALSLCMAFVVPALASLLLPGTAAGMYLQEQQRRTLGFVVLVPATVYLLYVSWYMLLAWWSGQPAVVEAGLTHQFAIVSLIFFVVVPSWIWSSSSPALWMAEVEQAQAVKRLRLTHEAELATLKATFARAIGLLEIGIDRLTIEQRQYLAQTIYGMHRYRNEQLRQVGRHIGTIMGVEDGMPWRDEPMLAQLDTVVRAIAGNETSDVPDDPGSIGDQQATHVTHVTTHEATHEATAAAAAYARAATVLGPADWTARTLAEALDIADPTARRLISEWRAAGWIGPGAMNGRWRCVAPAGGAA